MLQIISGFLAAVGGLLITLKLNSPEPTSKTRYEIDSIAVIVIGESSLDVLAHAYPLEFPHILYRRKKMVLLK